MLGSSAGVGVVPPPQAEAELTISARRKRKPGKRNSEYISTILAVGRGDEEEHRVVSSFSTRQSIDDLVGRLIPYGEPPKVCRCIVKSGLEVVH